MIQSVISLADDVPVAPAVPPSDACGGGGLLELLALVTDGRSGQSSTACAMV